MNKTIDKIINNPQPSSNYPNSSNIGSVPANSAEKKDVPENLETYIDYEFVDDMTSFNLKQIN